MYHSKLAFRAYKASVQPFKSFIPPQDTSLSSLYTLELDSKPTVPNEIQVLIISHLDYKSLYRIGQVCRAWHSISLLQNLWRVQLQVSFGIPINMSSSEDWRKTVIEAHDTYKSLSDAEKLLQSLENGHFVVAKNVATAVPSLLTTEILHTASKHGHLQVVELAIRRGVFVDEPSKLDQSTPVYIAAQFGFAEIVQLLILHGARYEFRYKNQFTPLYIASQKGHVAVVECLLSFGADINAKCLLSSTPLYMASQQGQLKVVELLLDMNASATILYKNFSCLFVAAKNGFDQILRTLLNRFPEMAHLLGGDGSSAIYVASQNGHAECVKLLMEARVNIEIIYDGFRPLYVAADRGNEQVVEALCVGGAVLDADNKGSVALCVAVQRGHFGCVKSLLAHGATVDIPTAKNRTPLYRAAQLDNLQMCELLLEHGASVDYVFGSTATPLYAACLGGHLKIVQLLLKRGASPSGLINSDKIPLHAAMEGNHALIIALLLYSGAETNELERVNCTSSTLEYTKSLALVLKLAKLIDCANVICNQN